MCVTLGPESAASRDFFHTGAGGPLSEPFRLEPGKTQRLSVDLGSLYPPSTHAVYAGVARIGDRGGAARGRETGRTQPAAFRVRRCTSLNRTTRNWGRVPAAATDPAAFRGRIGRRCRRAGLPERSSIAAELGTGPLKLKLRFPPFVATFAQPLVSTGQMNAGDLVYVFYVGPNRVRFGHELLEPGLGRNSRCLLQSRRGSGDRNRHGFAAPWQTRHLGASASVSGSVSTVATLLDTPRAFHPAEPAEVFVGHNGTSSSSSEVNFNGPLLESSRLARWPEAPTGGARLIRLKLPAERAGRSEPLLSTGVTGGG